MWGVGIPVEQSFSETFAAPFLWQYTIPLMNTRIFCNTVISSSAVSGCLGSDGCFVIELLITSCHKVIVSPTGISPRRFCTTLSFAWLLDVG